MTFKKTLLCKIILIIVLVSVFFAGCASSGKNSDKMEDGSYTADIMLEGGTGKATINSPVDIKVENGNAYATLVWTSKNYDYMIVDGNKYINESDGGYSTFTVPVPNPITEMTVIGDTIAMSVPHEIEYTLVFKLNE